MQCGRLALTYTLPNSQYYKGCGETHENFKKHKFDISMELLERMLSGRLENWIQRKSCWINQWHRNRTTGTSDHEVLATTCKDNWLGKFESWGAGISLSRAWVHFDTSLDTGNRNWFQLFRKHWRMIGNTTVQLVLKNVSISNFHNIQICGSPPEHRV